MRTILTRFLTGLMMIPILSIALTAQQSYDVTVESANQSHPNFGNTFSVVYALDGAQGAELTLVRGETYTFEVVASGHPFFLSTQQAFNGYQGEITDGVVNSRVQNGTLTFTPDADHPDVIWYQCGFHAAMGWKINLVEPTQANDFTAFLSGAREVSPVFTTATGVVEASLNGDELTLSGTFEGLSTPIQPVGQTGVHIHAGFTGQNGPVEIVLSPELSAGNTAGVFNQTVTLTSDQRALLQNRGLYINIHTERYPSGELRGQLLPANRSIFQAYASGGFEVPANTSTAQGGLSLEWDGSTLVVTGAFSGLLGDYVLEVGSTGSGAHLHRGFAGENGGVDISLSPTVGEDGRSGIFEAANNTFENVSTEIVNRLANRGHYLNIHSTAFPAGEIRGQVVPQANIYFYAPLSGAVEIPQNTSQATGAILVEWYASSSSIVATGSFSGLQSDYNQSVGSHLHNALAGMNGGVDLALRPELNTTNRGGTYLPTENTFTLTSEDVSSLVSRSWYVNIHSTDIVPGEIRGQVLPLAQHYFYAALTGLSEVQPVQTSAYGGVAVELRGNELTLSGSFSNLGSNFIGSPGVHIHGGAVGANGGVLFSLNPNLDSTVDARNGTFATNENVFSLSADQVTKLLGGETYVNVHSVENMPGEIRGQLLLAPNRAPATSPEILFPADGATIVLEGEDATPFEPEWSASEDADGDLLVYVWELSLDQGFENSIMLLNTGEATSAPLTIGGVNQLLAELGIGDGESATVWHRAYSLDGSGFNTGAGASVILQRSILTSIGDGTEIAGVFRLDQNYPNPFNPVTNIRYELPAASYVQLSVYNMLGQRVTLLINETQVAGIHTINFDASRLSSGTYLYRLESEGLQLTRKMMLMK